jgi:hypothetical protein
MSYGRCGVASCSVRWCNQCDTLINNLTFGSWAKKLSEELKYYWDTTDNSAGRICKKLKKDAVI